MTSTTPEKPTPSRGRSDAGAYAESILRSLRRIIRAIDQHSRHLSREFNLTVPQLVCLRQLILSGPSTPGNLASKVYLSQATVTGILDRLEARNLIKRERSSPDRRRVTVSLTDSGQRLTEEMPWPLQERFATRLAAMPMEGRQVIDQVLKQIVDMMEVRELDAWPIVGSGIWNDEAEQVGSG
ncbi:MAG: MarR family winged helix-turn-helix transcriptional regulator [Deltaproteobacteria bacterium]|nr:MarR family winged helix-turn-helix transcriptional regulator [Deltaproteobacteria bacterium]